MHFFPGLGAIACIVFGLGILENSIDRQQRLDRNLLEAFLEHIPDNVFFKDLDSRFVRISSAMAKYCGLRNPAQAIRKTDADIFGPSSTGKKKRPGRTAGRRGC
jgi:PAS domain-containing protein